MLQTTLSRLAQLVCVVGIAGQGAVAVTVRVRSQVEAISYMIECLTQVTIPMRRYYLPYI